MTTYVEFCAGAGGTRAGLDSAGWECQLAIDNDPDAVAIHTLAHGSATHLDLSDISTNLIPDANVWVAGFPCQPFSTSGNKKGFGHKNGNTFEQLLKLAENIRPQVLLLENVEGLLRNKSGYTFSRVLLGLTKLGYSVEWLLINLKWFGVPQTRPRLFIVAWRTDKFKHGIKPISMNNDGNYSVKSSGLFKPILEKFDITVNLRARGSLSSVEHDRRPAIGKPRVTEKTPFGAFGGAFKDSFCAFDIKVNSQKKLAGSLGGIVAPDFFANGSLRSARYYARGKPTKLSVRDLPLSHCIGTSLGGAPLYAVPVAALKSRKSKAQFTKYANWQREQDGYLVIRLRPDRAVKLFGPDTESLYEAFKNSDLGDTRKYKLVGNMVAPVCAKEVAETISNRLYPKN